MPDIIYRNSNYCSYSSWQRDMGSASIEIVAPDPGGDFPTAYEEGEDERGG